MPPCNCSAKCTFWKAVIIGFVNKLSNVGFMHFRALQHSVQPDQWFAANMQLHTEGCMVKPSTERDSNVPPKSSLTGCDSMC